MYCIYISKKKTTLTDSDLFLDLFFPSFFAFPAAFFADFLDGVLAILLYRIKQTISFASFDCSTIEPIQHENVMECLLFMACYTYSNLFKLWFNFFFFFFFRKVKIWKFFHSSKNNVEKPFFLVILYNSTQWKLHKAT